MASPTATRQKSPGSSRVNLHQVPHLHQPAMPPQRRVLGEISHNIVRRKELSPFERGKIVGKAEDGLTQRQISKVLNVPKSTVNDTIQKYLSTPTNGQSSPRSGLPKSIDVRTERRIIRFVRTASDAKYSEIKRRLGLTISKATIYRILKRHGITNWRKRKRPALTKEHARQRLLFCRRYRRWRSKGWKKVIWSDECSVERGKGKSRSGFSAHHGKSGTRK